ncbi:ralA-binding protein 1-A-like isoform X2 [Eriocheir sinensis]|nr:ralA-binding protein 1-A-like isoform X2 [Eriocheir sinensis]
MEGQDTRNPLKPKKQKSFKFLHKREKEEKEDRKEEKRKEKVERKIDKRKEKEERRKEKEEKKRFKKDKKKKEEQEEEEVPVFGVPLCLAVQRCPAHDGIQLPAIVRECIDQIEERGLHCEGIYRLSGVKSKVHQLRRLYNTGEAVRLCDQEPHVIASLLKQYLRELPEPVLTSDMMPHFEDVAMIPNPGERAEAMRQLINRLPTANRLLLQYMFKHMGHIIARERDTKMTYQNVSIVLSPTMQISHRVLNVFFLNHAYLFGGVAIKKYIPPIGSSSSGSSGERSLEQLQSVAEIEVEMMKQESLLAHLHTQVTAGQVSRSKEERLWEAQRIVTLLKRKLRSAQRREEEERGRRLRKEPPEREVTSEECEGDISSYRGGASASEDSSEGGGGGGGTGGTVGGLQRHPTQPTTTTTTITTTNNVTVISTEEVPTSDDCVSGTAIVDECSAVSASVSVAPQTDGDSALQGDVRVPSDEPKTEEEKEEEEKKEEEEENKASDVIKLEEEEKKEEEEEKERETGEQIDGERREEGKKERRKKEKELEEEEEEEEKFTNFTTKISTNERGPQVTVIQIVPQGTAGVAQGASGVPQGRGELPPPPRPEARRLAVEKVTLRETRSLDDTRPKDSELLSLVAREMLVAAEHEELLSMNHDLMRKLKAERAEITRLREEIQEMQTLYGYRTYSYDSSESDGSESDRESDTEEEMLTRLSHVTKANRLLQEENRALTRRIQEEREAVVQMRVRLQQAQWRDLCPDTPMAPVC